MKNNTVFVLLAGGKSERMGTTKGLLIYKNTYWILEQLNRISKSTISEVFIGLGFNSERYFNAIPWLKESLSTPIIYKGLKIKTVINNSPELGSFSTLQTVLKTCNPTENVVINPIDIPLLNTIELNKILVLENEIVMPSFTNKNGHPIKMNAVFWQKLITIDLINEDARLDLQIKKLKPTKISIIEVFDRAILYNLNTKKDWNTYLAES